MNVALVHMRHSGTGGTERYLNQISADLADRGHEVTIVCRSHEEAPRPGVRFAVLRDIALGGAWRMWSFARAVERHVAAARYDVVFALGKTWTHDVIRLGGGCHQTYLDSLAAGGGRAYALKDRAALAIESRALRPGAYERIVVNSEMVKRDVLRRHRVDPARTVVIYNGVALERFHPRRHRDAAAALRRSCGFGDGDFVVLFLGSGYERKGLGRLLAVFPEALRRNPSARLLVVGYDSAKSSYEKRAASLGLGSKVCFLGGRRDAEVCFAAANLYALPTLYDPFANSTLEALASGLPVITTSSNGGGEVLEHGVDGSVVSAADHDALARELRFWCNPSTAARGSTAARAKALSFPQERTTAATAALLEEVAPLKGAPRAAAGA